MDETIDRWIESIKEPGEWTSEVEDRELFELHKDAVRARKQADELCRLNPKRSGSYCAQFKATLSVIEGMAMAIRNAAKPSRNRK